MIETSSSICCTTTYYVEVRFPALHTKLIQAKIENIVVMMRYKSNIFMLNRDTNVISKLFGASLASCRCQQ